MSKPFRQLIKNVQSSTALVESRKGNIYPVIISDKVRLTKGIINVGDIALVRRVNGKYYMVDVEKKDNSQSYLTDIKPEDMGYDY